MSRRRPLTRARSLAVGVMLLAGLAEGAQSLPAPADEHPKLPSGPGRELMIKVCSPCHSPDVAAEQQLDAAGWKDLVDQMASKGATATDDEFEEIVRYLANAFPASK